MMRKLFIITMLTTVNIWTAERDLSHLLFNAVKAGNRVEVRRLINEGADVNLTHERYQNESPLQGAVRKGHGNIIAVMLLAAGARVNHTNDSGETPLHYACIAGNVEGVRLLVNAGAIVNCKHKADRTPLWYAAVYHKHAVILEILLTAGALLDEDSLRYIRTEGIGSTLLPVAYAYSGKNAYFLEKNLPKEELQQIQERATTYRIQRVCSESSVTSMIDLLQRRKRGIKPSVKPVESSVVWRERNGINPTGLTFFATV